MNKLEQDKISKQTGKKELKDKKHIKIQRHTHLYTQKY